jgi:zinc transporter
MSWEKSLLAAYQLDGKGGGKKASWSEIDHNNDEGVGWIHLDSNSCQTEEWLNKSYKLDSKITKLLFSKESRPRCIISADGILLILRDLSSSSKANPQDMLSIKIWIDKHHIITTCNTNSEVINEIISEIERGQAPNSSTQFFVRINNKVTRTIGEVLLELIDKTDELEDEIITAQSNLLRPKIADIRRKAILLHRYLVPHRDACSRLELERLSPLTSEDDIAGMREASQLIMRYLEDIDSIRDRTVVNYEQLESRLVEQMNQRMYMLSMVAVIFLPLSFITGLLGINVGGIPGVKDHWAFPIVCISLFILLGLMLYYFHRKKWI